MILICELIRLFMVYFTRSIVFNWKISIHCFRCTFEIIHLAANQNKNKSPVIHAENNLGLESWCTQHVYEYAHKTIFNKKIDNPKSILCISIVKYLNCAILINPDVATFWNIRRKLFINNKLNITKEFKFSSIVLSKKPKSNEAFCYRRWLFSFQSK